MTIQEHVMQKRREQGLHVSMLIDGEPFDYYPATQESKKDVLRRAGNTKNCEVLS